MRTVVTLVLIAVLATDQLRAQQPASDSSIKQAIAGIPPTSVAEVRMKAGDKLRGHIVDRTDTDFSLKRAKAGRTQRIAYDQVLSVAQVKSGHSHKKWIIIGVVCGSGSRSWHYRCKDSEQPAGWVSSAVLMVTVNWPNATSSAGMLCELRICSCRFGAG